jgi:predicted RNase H-like nuclease (RuvC/YqgF family)
MAVIGADGRRPDRQRRRARQAEELLALRREAEALRHEAEALRTEMAVLRQENTNLKAGVDALAKNLQAETETKRARRKRNLG